MPKGWENESPSSLHGLLWHHLKYRKEEGHLMTDWQGWKSRLSHQPLLAGPVFPVVLAGVDKLLSRSFLPC